MANSITTSGQTTKYTNDVKIIQKMINDLHVLISEIGATFIGGDEVRGKPKNGLQAGQSFIMIGIKDEDDAVVKTNLKAKGILKTEGADFCEVEMNGYLCPLFIKKKFIIELQ